MKTWIILLSLLLVPASMAHAEKYVVVNPDESIHTIEDKPGEVLQPGMERFTIQDNQKPVDHPVYYTFDRVNQMFVRRPQSEIDAIDADISASNTAYDLILKEQTKSAAQGALAQPGLPQSVRDKLTDIMNQ